MFAFSGDTIDDKDVDNFVGRLAYGVTDSLMTHEIGVQLVEDSTTYEELIPKPED